MSLPIVDIGPFATGLDLRSPAAHDVAETIDRACRELGFLLVTGHGVRDTTKAALLAAMRDFFSLPTIEKERIAIGRSVHHRGYVGMEAESLEGALADGGDISAYRAGDLKETIDSGIEHGPDHPDVRAGTPLHGPNQLPDLPGFRVAWQNYFDEVNEAHLRVQRGLALALGLEPTFFEDLDGETMLHLRMLHYPPSDRVTPAPGQLGCGTHTDYGTVTLLADDGVGGLQVQQRSGEWIDVVVPDGHLVVNLGDLMAIWTNDRYVSNPHRVVNPIGRDRYSIPLFVTPPFHARIECLPTCRSDDDPAHHEPLTAGPYLLSRFDGTHSYRNPILGH